MAVDEEGRGGRARRYAAAAQAHVEGLHPSIRGLLWAAASGLLFVVLNAVMRGLSLALSPFQTQFLRYVFGLLVMLPFVLRSGVGAYLPHRIAGQFLRGGVHTLGLCVWFLAIPHISLADTTALGFTTPIFIMIGAVLVLGERLRWERWVAALIGFAGVLIVVAPKLSGSGGGFLLVMLASSPLFAASFLLTKTLTRFDRTEVIVVWQAITVALLSMPLGLMQWHSPSPWQWVSFVLCGVLGSAGHYCLTRSFTVADISATQSVKFLDLVWAAALGWVMFSDLPSRSTLVGGAVIAGSTLWIARRESRRAAA
ncbi:DMT family transporter [Caenimonas terrae]|uniref:DMT family transporter n=1 Tax=Caenimonas terrae TaxID=696074 RepID=A0ABW0N6U9_9BURK